MVLLDTSFIIQIASRPAVTDIAAALDEALGSWELRVPQDVVRELNALATKSTTRRCRDAVLALKYAEGLNRVFLEGEGPVDMKLKAAAKKRGCAVATLDSALLKELRTNGSTVVTLRSGLLKVEKGGLAGV